MFCSTCKGNVYVDKTSVSGTAFDLACLHCGRRWHMDAKTSDLAGKIYKDMMRRTVL